MVDTGSRDGSPELAESAGARVVQAEWVDDFSTARNTALDVAGGEWVLYIDADERLRPVTDWQAVRDALESEPCARTVCLHPRLGWTGYREYRLWRNETGIRFEGVIHETVVPSLAAAMGGDLGGIPPSGLVIDHVGYEGDLSAKHSRNLPMLLRGLEVDPDRVYLWHDLGCCLRGLGRTEEAERAWQEGIERVHRRTSVQRMRPEYAMPFIDLIASRAESGDPVDALVEEATALFPDNQALLFIRGARLAQQGCHGEAAEVFALLASVDPATIDGGVVSYPRDLFTVWAPAALATSLFRLGRFEESAGLYERLADTVSSPLEYRVKAQLARSRAVRHHNADQLLGG